MANLQIGAAYSANMSNGNAYGIAPLQVFGSQVLAGQLVFPAFHPSSLLYTTPTLRLTVNGSFTLTSGTITQMIWETSSFDPIYNLSGISIPATSAFAAVSQATIFAGNDFITGSDFDDTLLGYAGNDRIDGGDGNDSMVGAAGNDTIVVDSLLDIVVEALTGGTADVLVVQYDVADGLYTISPSMTIEGVLYSNFEGLMFEGEGLVNIQGSTANNRLGGNDEANSIVGGTGNDTLEGGGGNDTLNGEAGNDVLDGGTGADLMNGGVGNDTYFRDSESDVIVDSTLAGAAGGLDVVMTSVHYNLAGTEIENAVITATSDGTEFHGSERNNSLTGSGFGEYIYGAGGNDTLVGNGGADELFGDAGNDSISGGDGNDTLDGGLGNDTMVGGTNDDYYFVNVAGDVVTELATGGSGNDTVEASFNNYTLAANVEHLVLANGAGILNGFGNTAALANTLQGNTNANKLDGRLGNDTYIGSDGDDTYTFTEAGDSHSGTDGGSDTVLVGPLATAYLNLSSRGELENATFTGTTAVTITGNANDNSLLGNSGNDTLLGGTGADTLNGGNGNDRMFGGDGDYDDVYIVNAAGDQAIEGSLQAFGVELASVAFGGENGSWGGLGSLFPSISGDGRFIAFQANTVDFTDPDDRDHIWVRDMDDDSLEVLRAEAPTEDSGPSTGALVSADGSRVAFASSDSNWVGDASIGGSLFYVDLTDPLTANPIASFEGMGDTQAILSDISPDGRYVVFGTTNGAFLDAIDDNAANVYGGLYDAIVVADLQDDSFVIASHNGTLPTNNGIGAFGGAAISEDGRFVVFNSTATNLVAGDTNNQRDVFVRDLDLGTTTRVSVAGANTQATGGLSTSVDISADGRYVLFESAATNLVASDSNATSDIFLRDRSLNTTTRVNTSSTGTQAQNGSTNSALGMSSDGRWVLFSSTANNLVAGDADVTVDVFVKDVVTGETVMVSRDDAGAQLNYLHAGASISDDGRYIALGTSSALQTSDGDSAGDIYRIANPLYIIPADGTDRVEAAISYTLGANIENLTLTGTAANGTGNGSDNLIVGNSAANSLNGMGGADTMRGLGGNDTYVLDDDGDSVDEAAPGSSGIDQVRTTVDYTLETGVEHASITGGIADQLIGNTLANSLTGAGNHDTLDGGAANDTLTGNAGNDLLKGGGGKDLMVGGAGNDEYEVDENADVVTELATAGSGTEDRVLSTAPGYTMAANVEQLYLVGSGNINGTGNGTANFIWGNDGNNSLNGAAGNDTYRGSLGNDTYQVDAGDTLDFAYGDDGLDVVVTGLATVAGLTASPGVFDLSGHAYLEGITWTAATAVKITGNDRGGALTGGGGKDTLIGGDGSNTLNGGLGADSMTGGDGNDVIFVDNAADVADGGGGVNTLNLGLAGGSVTLGAGFGTGMTHVTLSGTAKNATGNEDANILTGNASNNSLAGSGGDDTLTGNAGSDTLHGGEGNDDMSGGDGADFYRVDSESDVVTETNSILGTGGNDTVESSVNYTLGANQEQLRLLGGTDGYGNAANNTITGSSDGNGIFGGAGNDSLVGNGGDDNLDGQAGVDTMVGGDGNDYYVRDVTGDMVTEANSLIGVGGNDTVFSAVSYTLGNFVENLELGGGNINGTGNTLANRITGGTGNNSLSGLAGADTYVGSAGNDIYVISEAGDGIEFPSGDADTDTVIVSIAGHTLLNIVDEVALENVTWTGSAGVTITGNDGDNVLTGGTGNDTIFGGLEGVGNDTLLGGAGRDSLAGGEGNDRLDGGLGIDTLDGGEGDDTYFFDGTDIVIETGTTLGDTIVVASGNFNAISGIENITLGGTGNTVATGDGGDNVITGNGGNNSLNGGAGNDQLIGGAGNDTLIGGDDADAMDGGAGNDTYFLDNEGDTVTDSGGALDVVNTSVDYELDNGIENATLTAGAGNYLWGTDSANVLVGHDQNDTMEGGLGNDSMTGNNGDDSLLGETGNDTLVGGAGNDVLNGGDGNDSMAGGAGDDYYYVGHATLDVVNETIAGSAGNDTIESTVSYTLGATSNVENLVLAEEAGTAVNATGNALNNALTGNEFDNSLSGGAGNDTLLGGDGNDILVGGAGNDSYDFDSSDTITEAADATSGVDTVSSSTVSITVLAANVEHATLNGALDLDATGNGTANIVTGNSGHNSLTGLAGNDTLVGGEGNDTLEGGEGNDSIAGDDGTDTVVYDGLREDFEIVQTGGGYMVSGPGAGTDTITGVERISFTDETDLVLADMFVVEAPDPTLVAEIDSGVYWTLGDGENVTLTYSFFAAAGADDVDRINDDGDDVFLGMQTDPDLVAMVESVLAHYSEVAGITFVFDSTDGTDVNLRFGTNNQTNDDPENPNPGQGGYAYFPVDYYPSDGVLSSEVWINNDSFYFLDDQALNFAVGTRSYATMLHEVGHAMGLQHSFDDGGVGEIYFEPESGLDTQLYTVMSYTDVPNQSVLLVGIDESGTEWTTDGNHLAQTWTLMSFDISTLQVLYGFPVDPASAGDTTYDFEPADYFYQTIWDGGGNDTINVSNFDRPSFIDLRGGHLNPSSIGFGVLGIVNGGALQQLEPSAYPPDGFGGGDLYDGTSNLFIAEATIIENATGGAGDDELIGNLASNSLVGNGGNDTLDGGDGVDALIGGDGNDYYVVDSAFDAVTEGSSGGTQDVVEITYNATGTLTTGTYANVEGLVYSGTGAVTLEGTAAANFLGGNGAANSLTGLAGNDTLDGGTGADTMNGGADSDTYHVDSASDVLSDSAGIDTVVTSLDGLTLGAGQLTGMENLTLTGAALSATGSSSANVIVGNGNNNTFSGAGGADTMTGGDGNDSLVGGDGVDVIYADAGDDIVLGGEGADWIYGGLGSDTLTGGDGPQADHDGVNNFVFDTSPSGGIDTITDFCANNRDTIWLDPDFFAVFVNPVTDLLPVSNVFVQHATAPTPTDGNHRLLFNTTTGALYYDADGSGGAASAVQFAVVQLAEGTTLDYQDFNNLNLAP